MKRRHLDLINATISSLALLLFSSSWAVDLHGQENVGTEKGEESMVAKQDVEVLAAEYLELKNMKAAVDGSVQTIVDNLVLQFPDANKVKLYEILEEALGWGAMGDRLLKLTSETYSADELKSLIEFYSSPAGKAALLKGEHFSSEYNKMFMAAYNEASEKMTDDMFEPVPQTSKGVGDEVRWTEYKKIDSDDCVSIPFVGRTCHTVTYKFEFRGQIAYVDSESETYDVHLTSAKVVPQEFVSAMYWTYKARAQAWADRQDRRSIEFEYVH